MRRTRKTREVEVRPRSLVIWSVRLWWRRGKGENAPASLTLPPTFFWQLPTEFLCVTRGTLPLIVMFVPPKNLYICQKKSEGYRTTLLFFLSHILLFLFNDVRHLSQLRYRLLIYIESKPRSIGQFDRFVLVRKHCHIACEHQRPDQLVGDDRFLGC
ncbi:MAG: hypothetical protein K0R47_2843 [Brevibacillus sp.]|nr:hypothetical protein [Brevibacillus sp.]